MKKRIPDSRRANSKVWDVEFGSGIWNSAKDDYA
jgi:hypothetical protein